MKRLLVCLIVALVSLGLISTGCAQPAPAPAPTAAPAPKPAEPTKAPAAAPTKPAEPTKAAAPAPAPTAAPAAKKVDYPQKGKSINLIVPWPAGGPTDIAARLMGSPMEKELGAPVQVVNKAGASSVVGITELVNSRPDGYTLAASLQPNTTITYVDKDANATYTRKDLQLVAQYALDSLVLVVKNDSPFKVARDMADAAKAKPDSLKFGTGGVKSAAMIAAPMWEALAGLKFNYVHLEGGAPAMTALLGGHVDVVIVNGSVASPHVKSGAVRLLGIFSKEESKFFPGTKTMEAQGYKVALEISHGLVAPAGTPKEIVDILVAAVKKGVDQDEVKKKMDELTYVPKFADTAQYSAQWDETEAGVRQALGQLAR